MSRTTLLGTLDEMLALLADTKGVPVAALQTAGCAKVYPIEPGASGWVKPCSVTISPSGIEPTEWPVDVRVYVAGDLPPLTARNTLVGVTVAVGDLLTDPYGPDRWAFGWQPELECWVAVSEVMVGREDGF